MSHRIKVLLADDTLIAREGWKKILTTEDDLTVVGEVSVAQETLHKVRELQPDVLLMDLKWFDDENAGTSAIAQIKREAPDIKVVAITAYTDLVPGARKAGAEAVLPKGFSKAELVDTIRAVHQLASFPLVAEPLQLAEPLSAREQEVLALMAKGMTSREIALQLSISMSTAKNHVRSVIGKLGATNRAQAVAIGFERGMLKENER
jgi:DNA-binding NarL/FixJ family response regulator